MAKFLVAPKEECKKILRVFGNLKNHANYDIMVDTRERITSTTEEVIVN